MGNRPTANEGCRETTRLEYLEKRERELLDKNFNLSKTVSVLIDIVSEQKQELKNLRNE